MMTPGERLSTAAFLNDNLDRRPDLENRTMSRSTNSYIVCAAMVYEERVFGLTLVKKDVKYIIECTTEKSLFKKKDRVTFFLIAQ